MKLFMMIATASFYVVSGSCFASVTNQAPCNTLTQCIQHHTANQAATQKLERSNMVAFLSSNENGQRYYLVANRFSDSATQRYYMQNRRHYERLRQYRQSGQYQVHNNRNNRRTYQSNNRQNTGIYRKTNKFKPGLMPNKIPARGEKVFVFNPAILTWAAYDANGNLIRKGHGSGGAPVCKVGKRTRGCLTPRGSFRIHAKKGPECRSSKYPYPNGGAKMPHCMFFHKGYAIHGSGYVPYFNASHGCIRVYPHDARWLHSNFLHYGTKVEVRSY